MTHRHSMRDLLHWATHRVPGIPAHVEQAPGHQGITRHEHARRHHAVNHRWNHSPARPPRVLVGWQTRIAVFFGQDLR
ncbi:hypothetical protein [Nocardia arthritidis]|uniref:hypothetical protein n=1 Tax=Nocardia arthritidis TaxID=228602 RepID=UPI00142D95D0|nr:hypothetical protein [Nocardia arthritidis]